MKYFIDTAIQSEIVKWKNLVHGVTSNPILLNRANKKTYEFCEDNVELFNNVFVQINSLNDVHEITEEHGLYRGNIIFKVPLLKTDQYNGYKLLKHLKSNSYRTCSTIVYDIAQFDYACEIGSEFSIVLYAKNNDHSLIERCCDLKQKRGYETKIVAASFRNTHQVLHCIHLGVDYATVPPKILEEVFMNDHAIEDYFDFYKEG